MAMRADRFAIACAAALMLGGCGAFGDERGNAAARSELAGPEAGLAALPDVASYRAPAQPSPVVAVTAEGIVGRVEISGSCVALKVASGLRYVLLFPEGQAIRTGSEAIRFNDRAIRDGDELAVGVNVIPAADWAAGRRPPLGVAPAADCLGDAYLLV